MGLKVWLPLNGDLHNQGCTPFAISSIEATPTFTAGKIGQCYQRTNSNSQLTNGLRIEDNLIDLFGSTASIAVWVKPLNTHTHYNGTILSSGNWNAKKWAFGVSQDNTKVDVLCGSYNTYINCTVPVNEWTHLVSIYDNGTCTLYKNGTYVGQLTGQKALETDATWTGICRETYAGGYFGFCGCINDLRIYDHCLSAAEVRKISQGLVLHYKLDSPYSENTINYAPSPYSNTYTTATPAWDASKHINAINVSNWGNGYNGGVSEPATGYHAMWNIIDNIPTIVFQNHNSVIGKTNRWLGTSSTTISTNITAGTKYTISYEQRTIDTLGSYTTCGLYYKYNSSAGNGFHDGCPKIGQNTILNTWQRFSYTFTRNANVDGTGTNGTIYVYGHYSPESTMQVRNIQLEIKDHATGYTITERNNQIIEDSSGYNHNGAIFGFPTIQYDSSRYNASINVNTASDGVKIKPIFSNGQTMNELSVSCWFKTNTLHSTTPNLFGLGDNAFCRVRLASATSIWWYTRVVGTVAATTKNCKNLIDNVWHHIAYTFKNGIETVYIDGQSIGSTDRTATGTYLTCANVDVNYWVLGGYSTTSERFFGNESDFRIYCTALDADAIRQLYEVGAKVDNKQKLHAFELVESNSKIQITKQGQIKCNELEEDEKTKFYQADQIIETNEIIEL